jgi:chromosome segregation ATPase
VSQPDLAYSFWSSDQPPLADSGVSESSDLMLPPSPANYQSVLDELARAQALDHERIARIYHLEQALDQALTYLDELKLQVHDQAFLEAQLATTEEFAYVQQQAIARLKLQLEQQRQMLEAQTIEVYQQNQTIQALLATTEEIAQLQQQELERLRSRLAQDQVEIQQHRSQLEKQLQGLQNALTSRQQRVLELEAESLAARTQNATLEIQLSAAQSQIQQLCLSLSQHQASLANLEVQLVQAQAPAIPVDLAPPLSFNLEHLDQGLVYDHQNPSIATLQQELVVSQVKVEELETQLAKQVKLQARWQQNFQELDAERDRCQSRIESLERESAEMQEQIFQQARQTSEYEAAIQHWKDRYSTSEQRFTQFRHLLEHIPLEQISQLTENHSESSLTPFIAELLIAMQKLLSAEGETQTSLPVPAPRLHPLELPDFLARRRIYRAK